MKEIKFVRSTRLLLAGCLFALAMQVQAQVGELVAVIQLYKALGGGWLEVRK